MYSEEENEAIDYFKADIEYLEEGLKNPNYIGRFITIQDREVKYLKTILNLIEKQSKSIEKLTIKNNDLLRKLRNRVKEVKKLQKYSLYKNEFANLNKRIEKQDKIINEMIEYINSNVILYPECDVGCEKDTNCRTCILKYFEEKVKDNK